jgi:uncharacterized protein YggE
VAKISFAVKGTAKAQPNVAYINVGISVEALTQAETSDKLDERTREVLSVLEANLIKKKDVKTSSRFIYSQYQDSSKKKNKTRQGHVGYSQIEVKTWNLDEVMDLLGQLAKLDVTLDGPRYGLDKPEELFEEARQGAIKAARTKAASYCNATQQSLDEFRLVELHEQYENFNTGRRGGWRCATASVVSGGAAPASEPATAPGEEVVEILINVVYESR